MAEIRVSYVIPIFRILDVEKARAFYVDFLGFSVDWEHRFDPDAPLYFAVSRAGMTLHLSEHHGDGTPGSYVHVTMTGLDEFPREVNEKGYRYMRPGIETTFYVTRCMSVVDPFGNKVHFNGPIGPAPTT